MPSWTCANRLGSEDDDSSGLRTWMWTSEAPASNASWVDSICSDTVTGSAGLSFLRGTEPVIATAMTTGLMANILTFFGLLVLPGGHGPPLSAAERHSARLTMYL